MTNEEAIKILKENCCAMCAYGSQNTDSCDMSSCDNKDAVKALEQQWSVLDKIRAEIEDLRFGQPLRKLVVDECLEIIDKYRAESEE